MLTQNIPFIDIESSDNYEIGYAIGNVLAEKIHLRKERLRSVFKSKIGASSLKQAAGMLKQPTEKFFPQYFKELTGIAEGAKINIDELILLCAEEEIVQEICPAHRSLTRRELHLPGIQLCEDCNTAFQRALYCALK